jgi:hypothetical protein
VSTELVFELESPATGFGLSVTDFGEFGVGDLTFQTDTGALANELVVASTPQSDGSLIFFGFTQEVEFSRVTVRATTVPDGIGVDGIYVVPASTDVPTQSFNSELDFLRLISVASFESFEAFADRPPSNDPIVSTLFTISPTLAPVEIRSTPNGGHFATEGVRYISPGSNTVSTELVFELESPATGFGLSVTDFGEFGVGDLTFQTDTGALANELVVASTPQSDGSLIFFGFTQEVEFSRVTVRATTVPDGIGVDGIYVVPAAVPGDFDRDGDVDTDDIDFYNGNLSQLASFNPELDLTGDGTITLADHDLHVTTLVQTSNGETGAIIGDTNLNGVVDVLNDAFALVGSLGNSGPLGYAAGDLNADSVVNVLGDAFRLVGNLGLSNAQ